MKCEVEKTEAERRKDTPVYSGVLKYFPRALRAIAACSKAGNDQHNPGQPLHWDRTKSQDELDALTRHLLDHASGVPVDTDGISHLTKVAWRALAMLEKACEAGAVIPEKAQETDCTEDATCGDTLRGYCSANRTWVKGRFVRYVNTMHAELINESGNVFVTRSSLKKAT